MGSTCYISVGEERAGQLVEHSVLAGIVFDCVLFDSGFGFGLARSSDLISVIICRVRAATILVCGVLIWTLGE